MRLKTITLVTILFSGACFSQAPPQSQAQVLNPTELETAKLAKLRSDLATLNAQLQLVKTNKQLADAQEMILQQQGQQKLSELLGQAESVKQAHAKDKTWDSADKITFNPQSGEAGQFTHNPEEAKKDVKQEDVKEKDEKGQKVVPKK